MNSLQSTDAEELFAGLAPTAAEHFRIHCFGAALVCMEKAAAASEGLEEALKRFPFLIGYNNQLAEHLSGLSASDGFARWCEGILRFEARASEHLPLRALRQALGLEVAGGMCLLTAGLIEEDARFGDLFKELQGTPRQRRPTIGTLQRLWLDHVTAEDFARLLRNGRRLGLLQTVNVDAPLQETALLIPPPMLEAMRGEEPAPSCRWLRHYPADSLLPLEELILPPAMQRALRALPQLVQSGDAQVAVIRGPRHNGRHTALGAVARAMGRGVLHLAPTEKMDEEHWRQAAAMALLRHAWPIAEFDLAPGETLALPEDWPDGVPLGIVLGRQGGLAGELASGAVTLTLEAPDVAARRQHWERKLASAAPGLIDDLAHSFRLAGGQIHRAARLARMRAGLAARPEVARPEVARPEVARDDVLEAMRDLNRQTLDALARRVPVAGDWSRLCVGGKTRRELEHLERRCRHRERLPEVLAGVPGRVAVGVRSLFTGPSGTGKTHAVRLLAAALQKDLYQIDLSAIVNKFIGETEKNLHRVLEAAEDLDVILLLDEGDALLGQRTDVQNANDRYANLETNFVLQRLESHQGILIVTTNARSRIDSAFERRMDVVVEFHAPEVEERLGLWQLHLPAAHGVSDQFLGEAASRCEFTGGQICNATQHAALLALDQGGVVGTSAVEAAIRREYLKLGAVCPLRHFHGSMS